MFSLRWECKALPCWFRWSVLFVADQDVSGSAKSSQAVQRLLSLAVYIHLIAKLTKLSSCCRAIAQSMYETWSLSDPDSLVFFPLRLTRAQYCSNRRSLQTGIILFFATLAVLSQPELHLTTYSVEVMFSMVYLLRKALLKVQQIQLHLSSTSMLYWLSGHGEPQNGCFVEWIQWL